MSEEQKTDDNSLQDRPRETFYNYSNLKNGQPSIKFGTAPRFGENSIGLTNKQQYPGPGQYMENEKKYNFDKESTFFKSTQDRELVQKPKSIN